MENELSTFQIESEPIFKVQGMVPVMQYRFMVTAIGPGGRLGGPVMSEWTQSLTIDEKPRTPGSLKMKIYSHYYLKKKRRKLG